MGGGAGAPSTALAPPRDAKAGEYLTVLAVPARRAGEPDSMGLARVTSEGVIRAVQTRVMLDPKLGHCYDLGANKGGWSISAAGYNHVNAALGVSPFEPETLIGARGIIQPNPWIQLDKNGTIKSVTVRMCGFGRSAVGNWMLVVSTLHFDLGPMLAQDALSAWRKVSRGGADWGILYSTENVPAEVRSDPRKRCIAIPGGTTLAVDLKGDVLDLIAAHTNRARFASRIAKTIAWSRVLQVFVGQKKLAANDLSVTVTAWPQPDRQSVHDVSNMIAEAQSGKAHFGGEIVDVQASASTVSDSDQAAIEGSGCEDEGEIPHEPEPGEVSSEVAMMRTQVGVYAKQLEPHVVDRQLGLVGLEGMEEVERTADLRLLGAASQALKEAAELRRKSKPAQKEQADDLPSGGLTFPRNPG